jgi:predicted membrane channel-forming protein YqfA (hemolysin III family)
MKELANTIAHLFGFAYTITIVILLILSPVVVNEPVLIVRLIEICLGIFASVILFYDTTIYANKLNKLEYKLFKMFVGSLIVMLIIWVMVR